MQLVQDTAKAINEGRSKAQLLHAVAVDKPPSELRALGAHSVTDCFTDPCGWLQPGATHNPADSQQAAAAASAVDHQSGSVQWRDLSLLRQLLQPGAVPGLSSSCCLVLAGLSTLLLRHAEVEVSMLLMRVAQHSVLSTS
jgi:hypothetical protein